MILHVLGNEYGDIVHLLGIVIVVNLLQLSNALDPIFSIVLGRVISVKLEQFLKADDQITLTLLGIVILVRLEQFEKQSVLSTVTLSGITTEVKFLHPLNVLCSILVILWGRIIDFRLWQFSNAQEPIFETVLGIVILVKL